MEKRGEVKDEEWQGWGERVTMNSKTEFHHMKLNCQATRKKVIEVVFVIWSISLLFFTVLGYKKIKDTKTWGA